MGVGGGASFFVAFCLVFAGVLVVDGCWGGFFCLVSSALTEDVRSRPARIRVGSSGRDMAEHFLRAGGGNVNQGEVSGRFL